MLSQLSLVLPLMSASDIQVVWNWGPHTWWMTVFRIALFVGFIVFLWFRGQDRVPATDLALKLRFGAIVHHNIKVPRQSRFKFMNWISPEKKLRGPRFATRFKLLNRVLNRITLGKVVKGDAKVYGPGLHVMWPGPDKFHKVDIRGRQLDLKPLPKEDKLLETTVDFHVDADSLKQAVVVQLNLDTYVARQAQKRQAWLAAHGVQNWEIPDYVINGLRDRTIPTQDKIPDFIIVGLREEVTKAGASVDDCYFTGLPDTEATQLANAFEKTGFNVTVKGPLKVEIAASSDPS